ncbi:radical SAM protein, partial [Candidatus Bathyarchaeota archaeon]
MDKETAKMFNETVIGTFTEARNLVKNTSLLPAALRFIKYQREAVQTREKWAKEGLHVPPVIILSVTKRCNLRCAGCYHHAQNRQKQDITT